MLYFCFLFVLPLFLVSYPYSPGCRLRIARVYEEFWVSRSNKRNAVLSSVLWRFFVVSSPGWTVMRKRRTSHWALKPICCLPVCLFVCLALCYLYAAVPSFDNFAFSWALKTTCCTYLRSSFLFFFLFCGASVPGLPMRTKYTGNFGFTGVNTNSLVLDFFFFCICFCILVGCYSSTRHSYRPSLFFGAAWGVGKLLRVGAGIEVLLRVTGVLQ